MFEPITVTLIWDIDRDDKGDRVDYVAALQVDGTRDGKQFIIHHEDEPPMLAVDFWRWLADQHGWAFSDE